MTVGGIRVTKVDIPTRKDTRRLTLKILSSNTGRRDGYD